MKMAISGKCLRAIAVLALACCGFQAADPAKSPTKTIPFVAVEIAEPLEFDRHVYPILAEKCTSCHDAEGGVAEGKLDMTTVARLLKGGKRGPAIVAGKGAASLAVQMSSHAVKPIMPPKAKNSLTPRELSIFKQWIDQGAKPGNVLEPARTEADFAEPPSLPPNIVDSLCADFSPDGKWLAMGRGGSVLVYDLGGKAKVEKIAQCGDLVQSVRFSPDSRLLAFGNFGSVRLAKPPEVQDKKWTEVAEFSVGPIRALALDFAPDGQHLAIGGGLPALPGVLSVWHIGNKKKVLDLPSLHADSILAVAFSSDGKKLATAGADKFARTVEFPSGKRLQQFEGHTDHVTGVAWLEGDKLVVSAGSDSTLRSWTHETGEPLRTLGGHPKPISAMRGVYGTSNVVTACADRMARLIDAKDGRHLRGFGNTGEYLQAVAVSKDGKWLAAVGPTGTPHLWHVPDGKAKALPKP